MKRYLTLFAIGVGLLASVPGYGAETTKMGYGRIAYCVDEQGNRIDRSKIGDYLRHRIHHFMTPSGGAYGPMEPQEGM